MTIKTFEIQYDAINSKNIFTNGDTINGRIIVEASKETKVQSLAFIGEGKARVCWSEYYGQNNHRVYWADEKYYSIKHDILKEARHDGTEIIRKGRHVFPFSFKIPDRDMPSTFATSIGKVVHKVKAELKQSMKLTKKAKSHFTFVARPNTRGLQEPQSGSKDKNLAFGSGSVMLDVHTPKRGYMQGETLTFRVEVINSSTRSVKPKYELYEKKSYFAQGHRKVETHKILKGKIIEDSAKKSGYLSASFSIPGELPASILNSSILRLEYRLKIFLDIKYAKDPKVKLPITILPLLEQPSQAPANPPFGFEALSNVEQPAPDIPLPTLDLPPPYAACATYPAPHGGAQAYPASHGGAQAYPAPYGGAHVYPAPYGGAHAYPAPYGGAQAYPAPYGGAQAYPVPNGGAESYPAPSTGAGPYPVLP